MKKSMRVFLFLISYILSFFVVIGIMMMIARSACNSDFFPLPGKWESWSKPIFFLSGMMLSFPLSLALIFPSMRAMYYRLIRRNHATLSKAKEIRRQSRNMTDASAAVFMLRDDEALTVTSVSPGFWMLLGRNMTSTHRNRALSLASMIHPDDLDDVRKAVVSHDLIIPKTDFRIIRKNGSVAWLRISGTKEEMPHSGYIISNCVAVDITEFRNAEHELREDCERYHQLINSLGSGVWKYTVDKDELYLLNRHMSDGKFRKIENFRESMVRDGIIHPDHIDFFNELCRQLTSGTEDIHGEIRMRNNSGNYCWYTVTGRAIFDDSGAINSYIGQIRQSDSQAPAERSHDPEDYDALTHLCNRYTFESLVNAKLRGRNRHTKGALFVINVDNFRNINASLGRLFGNALLIELSEALKNIFSQSSIFCRISGDEFAVYTDNFTSEEDIFAMAGAVCGCVRHCYINTEQTEGVTCCVGISLFPSQGNRFEQLFFRADSALVYAKHRGPGNYCVYSPELDKKLSEISVKHTHDETESVSVPSVSFQEDSLLSQVVDILFDSRELSISINLIIALLGRRFRLDRAYVLEFSEDSEHATITYSWHSERTSALDTADVMIPIADAREHVFCAARDEYFLCNDMVSFSGSKPNLNSLNERYGVRAMLQCPIIDGTDLIGCFAYAFCGEGDSFNESDVRQIMMITKIIIGYLVRLRSKQDIDRITYRDKLTGAMNFNAFQIEFERFLSAGNGRNHAIVYSDIDRFKFINEKYGYRAGDSILRTVAEIFQKALEPGEIFARVTGDKFITLMKYGTQLELDQRINAIHDSINHIQKTDTTCYYLPVRSGVYHIRPGDSSVSGIIDLANLARKSVKNIHISTISHFNDTMKSRLKRQKDIEQVMADALVREEFVVFYQPKFSLSTNRLAGAEALVRWRRPDSSVLMRPDEFIPIFEDNGFIIELDFYVLERVCRKIRRDIDSNIPVLPISVNFSRTHIKSEDLIPRLHDCLERYHIPPHLIEIEITESALTENESYLTEMISELHNIGLIVSMDDFGSGFSSLNLLKKLPVDILKIDKNFFAGDSATERERCIIENVVNMARALGIHVVSEGVETSEQASFLRSIKCDLAQGYLFGPPIDERSYEITYQTVQ